MSDEQKGLKFYLCQTPAGPQYVHLQADAKKIDPNYQTVFVDTSKQAIMERLNHLMAGPVQGIDPMELDQPEVDEDEPDGPGTTYRWAQSSPNAPKPAAVLDRIERTYAQIDAEAFICAVPLDEIHRLDALEGLIKSHRESLLNPGIRTQPPVPAASRRQKQWGKKA